MNCLRCRVQFSPSDILVMEEWELPVCDICVAEEHYFQVEYDGNNDFNEFLNNEIKTKTCYHCLCEKYEMIKMKFGNPVKVEVICTGCRVEDKMTIYIKYI